MNATRSTSDILKWLAEHQLSERPTFHPSSRALSLAAGETRATENGPPIGREWEARNRRAGAAENSFCASTTPLRSHLMPRALFRRDYGTTLDRTKSLRRAAVK